MLYALVSGYEWVFLTLLNFHMHFIPFLTKKKLSALCLHSMLLCQAIFLQAVLLFMSKALDDLEL